MKVEEKGISAFRKIGEKDEEALEEMTQILGAYWVLLEEELVIKNIKGGRDVDVILSSMTETDKSMQFFLEQGIILAIPEHLNLNLREIYEEYQKSKEEDLESYYKELREEGNKYFQTIKEEETLATDEDFKEYLKPEVNIGNTIGINAKVMSRASKKMGLDAFVAANRRGKWYYNLPKELPEIKWEDPNLVEQAFSCYDNNNGGWDKYFLPGLDCVVNYLKAIGFNENDALRHFYEKAEDVTEHEGPNSVFNKIPDLNQLLFPEVLRSGKINFKLDDDTKEFFNKKPHNANPIMYDISEDRPPNERVLNPCARGITLYGYKLYITTDERLQDLNLKQLKSFFDQLKKELITKKRGNFHPQLNDTELNNEQVDNEMEGQIDELFKPYTDLIKSCERNNSAETTLKDLFGKRNDRLNVSNAILVAVPEQQDWVLDLDKNLNDFIEGNNIITTAGNTKKNITAYELWEQSSGAEVADKENALKGEWKKGQDQTNPAPTNPDPIK